MQGELQCSRIKAYSEGKTFFQSIGGGKRKKGICYILSATGNIEGQEEEGVFIVLCMFIFSKFYSEFK